MEERIRQLIGQWEREKQVLILELNKIGVAYHEAEVQDKSWYRGKIGRLERCIRDLSKLVGW